MSLVYVYFTKKKIKKKNCKNYFETLEFNREGSQNEKLVFKIRIIHCGLHKLKKKNNIIIIKTIEYKKNSSQIYHRGGQYN